MKNHLKEIVKVLVILLGGIGGAIYFNYNKHNGKCDLAVMIADDIDNNPTHWKKIAPPRIKNPFDSCLSPGNFWFYEQQVKDQMQFISNISEYYSNDSLGVVIKINSGTSNFYNSYHFNDHMVAEFTIIKPDTLVFNEKENNILESALVKKLDAEQKIAYEKADKLAKLEAKKKEEKLAPLKCDLTQRIFHKN